MSAGMSLAECRYEEIECRRKAPARATHPVRLRCIPVAGMNDGPPIAVLGGGGRALLARRRGADRLLRRGGAEIAGGRLQSGLPVARRSSTARARIDWYPPASPTPAPSVATDTRDTARMEGKHGAAGAVHSRVGYRRSCDPGDAYVTTGPSLNPGSQHLVLTWRRRPRLWSDTPLTVGRRDGRCAPTHVGPQAPWSGCCWEYQRVR